METVTNLKDTFVIWLNQNSPWETIKTGLTGIKTTLTGYYNAFVIWMATFDPYTTILDGLNFLTTKGTEYYNAFVIWMATFDPYKMIKDGINSLSTKIGEKYDEFILFIENNNPIEIISKKLKEIIDSITKWVTDKFKFEFPEFNFNIIKDPVVKGIASIIPFKKVKNKFLKYFGVEKEPEGAPELEDPPKQLTPIVIETLATAKQEEDLAKQWSSNPPVAVTSNSKSTTNVNANKSYHISRNVRLPEYELMPSHH